MFSRCLRLDVGQGVIVLCRVWFRLAGGGGGEGGTPRLEQRRDAEEDTPTAAAEDAASETKCAVCYVTNNNPYSAGIFRRVTYVAVRFWRLYTLDVRRQILTSADFRFWD